MKNKILLGILLLTLITRLYHLTFPIIGWHSWRQSDTAAIARNFATENVNIFYPQIDYRGNTKGFVECEFQLYTFLIALAYKVFGIHEFLGRFLSIFCSVLTVLGIYSLAKRTVNERVALWASFFYSILPLSIFYGRTFMPEQMMLMFSVWGIYFFSEWLERNATTYFIVSLACISLAALLKLPALYLGLPLLFLSWNKYHAKLFAQPSLWIFAVLVFAFVAMWYYHAHMLKESTGLSFGIWEVGVDKWGNVDLLLSFKFYNDVFFKSIAERHFTYAAFVPFIAGLFIKRATSKELLYDYWLLAIIIYILIVARGNQVHEYYQLPFLLPAVVFLGKTFAHYIPQQNHTAYQNRRVRTFYYACLVLTLILSFLRIEVLFDGERRDLSLFKLADAVQQTTKPNDLIITVSQGNPVVLYNCERKGWICSPSDIDSLFLQKKKALGARYVVTEKRIFITSHFENKLSFLTSNYLIIKDDEDYLIAKL